MSSTGLETERSTISVIPSGRRGDPSKIWAAMPDRATIFVSYCHRDQRWLTRLKVHLKPFERRGDLDLWDDNKIQPGEPWQAQISAAIDRAAASVVLISADFLASDFVAVHELPKLLRQKDRSRIVPIFVAPCDLANHAELASLQAVNSPRKPLAECSRADADRVFVRAVETIGRILDSDAVAARVDHATRPAEPSQSAGEIFEELRSATITLSLVWALARSGAGHSLSELERELQITSRKKAYEALERLILGKWVEKQRDSGLTKYRITNEGSRQLQRLAAACDGPVRRAVGAPGC